MVKKVDPRRMAALREDGRRLVVVSVLDNLLKGAATQALQNLNRAFGLPETLGIPNHTEAARDV